MSESKIITVCGLWAQKTQNGEPYLSGSLGGAKILVFKNSNKTQENHPDYNICVAPKQQQQSSGNGYAPREQAPPLKDDGIPF